MDWITPQIAIGNFLDAKRISTEIDAILCLKGHCCEERRLDIDVLVLPLIDGRGNDRRRIGDAVQYIRDVVNAGDRILVHCHAGRSRSVSVVAYYLTLEEGLTTEQALARIEAEREMYLSPGIEEIFTRAGPTT